MNFQGDHTKHKLNFLSIFRHFYLLKESLFNENIFPGNNKDHDHISYYLRPPYENPLSYIQKNLKGCESERYFSETSVITQVP